MLSVVTITFNNFEELEKTVASVQGLQIEHIIINGGKCERTKDYLSKFEGISVSESDQGISDAFNKGIRMSTGKGIVFLNSGDLLIDKNYFTWEEKTLEEVDFVYSDVHFEDEIAGKLRIKPSGKPLGRGMPFPHQTMIVRRELFTELGAFDLGYKRAMCFEFACRLIRAGKSSRYYPEPTVLQDGTGISVTQEAHTLRESRRAMAAHGLYGLENRLYFAQRKALFYARRGLIRLGLRSILATLKRIKRRN